MKSSTGQCLELTLFGESHSASIGAILNGMPAGVPVDEAEIDRQMDKRRAKGNISTKRHEADRVIIESGIFNGYTTGTPIGLRIENTVQRSKDYEEAKFLPRPSHADYTAFLRYGGYQDYRGGGHFSGRLTAPIVAAGAICMQALARRGILIGSHIRTLHTLSDRPFSTDEALLRGEIAQMNDADIAVLDEAVRVQMIKRMEAAVKAGDSVGGTVETAIIGLPGGIGEPFFGSVESRLSAFLFSIPAVKGVIFGDGDQMCAMYGSEANDPFYMKDGKVSTKTNHNGGINGGITNGMPVRFTTMIKPTPSIFLPQETVDLQTGEDAALQIHGRHDPAIIHRARVVLDSAAAIVMLDLLIERFGPEWVAEPKKEAFPWQNTD